MAQVFTGQMSFLSPKRQFHSIELFGCGLNNQTYNYKHEQ